MLNYLTTKEVIQLSNIATEEGDNYVKSYSLIDSAVNNIKQIVFGVELYPSFEEKATILLYSLANNHGFHNGNKRTALLSFLTFLKINNYNFTMPNKAIFDILIKIADNKITKDDLLKKCKDHIIKL